MKVIQGDLVELAKQGKFNVIIHGANCFCKMSKGIAPQIKESFPEAFAADQRTVRGDKNKLGTISSAWVSEYNLMVVNAYTQYDYRSTYENDNVVRVDYDALRSAFKTIAENLDGLDLITIGYPKIGCGLAGGDWDVVSKIIDEEFDGLNHTFVEYK